jgi:hypothetical protein
LQAFGTYQAKSRATTKVGIVNHAGNEC